MRPMLGLVIAMVLIAAAGAAALPPTTVQVGSVAVSGSDIHVEGTVVFGPDEALVGSDSAGDVPPGAQLLGVDLTGARIASDPATPGEVSLVVDLASLPPVLDGIEHVEYEWDLLVDGEPPLDATRVWVDWERTRLTRTVAAVDPSITLAACWPGQVQCQVLRQLEGSMDAETGQLVARLPLAALEAAPGVVLDSPGVTVRSLGDSQPGNHVWDRIGDLADYTTPSSQGAVRLALAAPGSEPTSFPVAVTPKADGSFTARIAAEAGEQDLVVRGCWGSNCGSSRTRVP